ncbi:hypothetical protein RF11_09784 [Thelohanellus kitauei]|uniref:Peptidase A2 domain-containing protein n=1 Tax=Thelohanellus kitauei TaxID=669202 RepID=A0A0C2IVF5_THEKT|nr:hypothetical protein RF11_09784 [Thelohanellus kitauei]
MNPPANNKYQRLKDRLIKVFGLITRRKATQLLEFKECSDRKPSAILAEMWYLSGGHRSCMLFEEIFLRQLPANIRLQLAHSDFMDLDILGEYAEEIWQARAPNSFIDAFKAANSKVQMPPRLPKTNVTQALSDGGEWCFFHKKYGFKAKKCTKPCSFSQSKAEEPKLATVSMAINKGSLLYLNDNISGRRFLVYTGAEISVIPASREDRLHPNQNASLTAVNGTRIRAYRERTLKIHFGRMFQLPFITADVDRSIIGADFLKSFNLMVDLRGKSLVDPRTSSSISY